MPLDSDFLETFSSFPFLSLKESKVLANHLKKHELTVMDVGCGTNDTVPLFYEELSHEELISNAHIYLVDQNSLWLSILYEKLKDLLAQKEARGIIITLVRKKLEELTRPSQVEIYGDPPNPTVFGMNKFMENSIDILHLNSNMLYWFDFFKANIIEIFSNLEKITRQDALMILTQFRGQPEPDFTALHNSSFSLREVIVFSSKGKRISRLQPIDYRPDKDSFRGFLFQKKH